MFEKNFGRTSRELEVFNFLFIKKYMFFSVKTHLNSKKQNEDFFFGRGDGWAVECNYKIICRRLFKKKLIGVLF